MCCFHPFFGEQRSILTPSATSGADRWEENTGVWIKVDTSTCRQTRRTSQPALRSQDGHISLFRYRQILSAKKHSWAGQWEAIWDIDNEINTEEQTKEKAVCTQYDCFNSQRNSQEGGEKKKHKLERQSVVPVWLYFHWFFSFYFNSKSEADRDHHNRNMMSERSVVPLFCLFVLKTSLAVESTTLSEYKRCLRGT